MFNFYDKNLLIWRITFKQNHFLILFIPHFLWKQHLVQFVKKLCSITLVIQMKFVNSV